MILLLLVCGPWSLLGEGKVCGFRVTSTRLELGVDWLVAVTAGELSEWSTPAPVLSSGPLLEIVVGG